MQKNNKKIFEDYKLNIILKSTFINGIDKIKLLDKCLELIDDIDIQLEYLLTWRSELEIILKDNTMQNHAGKSVYRIISTHYKKINGKRAFKDRFILKNPNFEINPLESFLDHYEHHLLIYKALGLGKFISKSALIEKLFYETENWDLSSITIYYKKPLFWIERKIDEIEKPVLTANKIKVNIVPSQFVLLIKEMHENGIITLPTHENDKINNLSSSTILLSVYEMGKNLTSPKLLSANFNDNPCSKKVQKEIEHFVKGLNKNLTKIRKR